MVFPRKPARIHAQLVSSVRKNVRRKFPSASGCPKFTGSLQINAANPQPKALTDPHGHSQTRTPTHTSVAAKDCFALERL